MMRKLRICCLALLTSVALSAPALLSGCSGRVTYYDSAYGDYHPWNHQENLYYERWEGETHRRHMQFRDRSHGDQDDYWRWRHSQH